MRKGNKKLSPLNYGPFLIEEKIEAMAYRVKLPTGTEIHPVLHVSPLKAKVPNTAGVSTKLPKFSVGPLEPMAILDKKNGEDRQ